MRNPWLTARMVIVSTVLFGFYGLIALLLMAAGGTTVAALGIPVLLCLQYYATIELPVRRLGAKELPEEDFPELHSQLEDVSNSMGLAKPNLLISDMDTLNALALGRRGHGVVIISTSMIQEFSMDELEGVIAHECAHLKNRDAVLMMLGQSIATFLSIGVLAGFWIASLDSKRPLFDLAVD